MKQKWHIFHTRHRTPFYVALYTQGNAYGKRKEKIGIDYRGKLYHINGEVAMRMSEWERRQTLVARQLQRDQQFLLRMMRLTYADYRRFLPLWRKIGALSVQRLTNAVLSQWFKRYRASIEYYWTLCMLPLYVEDYLTELIHTFVRQHLPKREAEDAFQTFVTPKKEGVVGLEYRSLLSVAILPKEKQAAALKKHGKKFCWIANQLYTGDFFSLSYYQKRLEEVKTENPKQLLQKYLTERREHQQAFRSWIKRLKPDPWMRMMIESLNEAIFYRSWRGERTYQSGYTVAPLLEEVAKRLGISMLDFLYCLPKEIEAWLKKGKEIPQSFIEERKKGFIYIPTRTGKILTGADITKWKKEAHGSADLSEQIKGMVAYRGHVRGRAKVIRTIDELSKIDIGDILITTSTTPMYVPVLEKVSAIVTEEGGVLSHASVISREMKIPCVIGTKVATKIFKDGDMVEVDAEKGIVRKI